MMDVEEILAIIMTLTALFAYLNKRFIGWPPTIAIMAMSLFFSLPLIFLNHTGGLLPAKTRELVDSISFEQVLMNFMLSFLLFAGALHVDANKLRRHQWPVLTLAGVGTILSTVIIGTLTWGLFNLFKSPIPYIPCLIFGALISPTDPVAVLGILKTTRIPASLELKIAGESLFNDGVALVLFVSLVDVAQSGTFSWGQTGWLFLKEAGGGISFGFLLGWLTFLALRSIDDYKTEILITLATVMGGYFLAGRLHLSGPLAMVVAGLIIGTKIKKEGMSRTSREYFDKFWELVDEIFNAVLFLLIGLEMLIVAIEPDTFWLSLLVIPGLLLARWLSVTASIAILGKRIRLEKHGALILTWGGLRGGISIALCISLPASLHREKLLLVTYSVVVFSILFQGLTIGPLVNRLTSAPAQRSK